jgi:hypothetical protein
MKNAAKLALAGGVLAAASFLLTGCVTPEPAVDATACLPGQCCANGLQVACVWGISCYGYHPTEWRRWPTECEPAPVQIGPVCPPGVPQPATCPKPAEPQAGTPQPPPPPRPQLPSEAEPPTEETPRTPTPFPFTEPQQPNGQQPGALPEPPKAPLPVPPQEEGEPLPAPAPPGSPIDTGANAVLGPPPRPFGAEPTAPPQSPTKESDQQLRLLSFESISPEIAPKAPLPEELLP